ncbi:alanine racemase [Flavobacteriaceae bacterium KMM 6898]|nr:alanine racemase [Flavobacteriaceae bacterium KMM 6898]
MPKATETVLEIDLGALEHNYQYLRSKIEPSTKFLGVVKAFAYGNDSVRVAQKLEELGVDYFAVAYAKEGVVLRDAGIKSPILVLHPLPSGFETIIERCLEPSIYSEHILDTFLETARKHGQKDYPIHLKFNTGLNRLGFKKEQVLKLTEKLIPRNELKVVSVFSHLAATEDHNEREFTLRQINTFEGIAKEVEERLGYQPKRHILNTSGIINYPEAQFDMVRSGIGLYGYGNEAKIDAQLRPIATLKTIISQIHVLEPNESVGYNRAYKTGFKKVTATLPLGHADGIGRPYGNGKGQVYINGKMAPILGNVCMDMIMVDVSDIDCKEGDEVIVFGPQNSAEKMANRANTISYELLTGISQRVKRVFLDSRNN